MSEERCTTTAGPPGEDEIRATLERARGGDAESLPAAREALDADPGIWRHYGDLAAHARRSWIELIAGRDLVLQEALVRKVGEIEADLAGPAPSPMEALLIGRIGASWLQASYADAAAARAVEVPVKQAELLRKRQDSAHRRHLMAIAALATVRRLLGPAGRESGAPTPAIAPGIDDGAHRADVELGDRGAIAAERDLAAEGLVLEFGPHREGAADGNQTRRPGKSRASSRP